MYTSQEIIDRARKQGGFLIGGFERAAYSYPVCGLVGGRLADCFFLTSNAPKTVKPRPAARLVIDAEHGDVLLYERCAAKDFAASTGVAPGTPIDYAAPQPMPYQALKEARARYLELYEQVRAFAFTDALAEEQKTTLAEFRAVMDSLISPQAMPFYRALAGEFFDWMER